MEVSFPSADKSFDLYGDLYLPEESSARANNNEDDHDESATVKIPAVVVVAGSGPIDRNGNATGLLTGLKLNTSNRFAEYMRELSNKRRNSSDIVCSSEENATTKRQHAPSSSSSMFAVLTYDKRGVGKSLKDGDSNWYYRAGMMDLVSDAVEAVRFLQTSSSHHNHDTRIIIDPNSIVVLGHSEGSIILPLICQAVRNDDQLTDIKGSIFLSGFGENLFDAIQFQQENTIQEVETMEGVKGWMMRKLITRARVEKQQQDLMEKIFDSQVDMDYISMYCGIAKIPANWFREHKAFQAQAVLASEMTCHCLAITGGKDVQVRHEFCEPATARSLVPRAASIESHILENMTHVLRCIEGPPSMLSLKQDYAHQGSLPLDSKLLDLIVDWCDRRILQGK